MVKAIRTVSRNGQIAIPKRFLEALGLTPPVKVQVSQERGTVSIRPQPAAALSSAAFETLLQRLRRRNLHATRREVEESLRPLASFEDLRRHFTQLGIASGDVHRAVAWARRRPRR